MKPLDPDSDYERLFLALSEHRLYLRTSRNLNEAVKRGGDYFVLEPFGQTVLFASDDLYAIAKWFRVPGLGAS
jgi:hypothetical protein